MNSTKHFSISTETDSSFQGTYCSYCGHKIVPEKDEDTFIFRCSCPAAAHETSLLNMHKKLVTNIDRFYSEKEKTMQITKLRTIITTYEGYVRDLKKELQIVLNESTTQ